MAAGAASDVADLRRAHLAHYVDVAERARAQLAGPDQIIWNERLALDHENFLAALAVGVERPECTNLALRVASALGRYWTRNGHCGELIGLLSVLCDREGDGAERAAGFAMLSLAHVAVGEARAGYDAAEAAVGLARPLGDPQLVGRALKSRSAAADLLGEHDIALADANEACALAAATTDFALQAEARSARAIALYMAGDSRAARDECLATIDLHRAVGDIYGEACELINLADIELETGDLDGAAGHLRAAEPLTLQLGSPDLASTLQGNMGLVAARAGDDASARRRFVAALRISARTHDNQTFVHSLIGYAHSVAGIGAPLAATLDAAAEELLRRLDLEAGPNEVRLGEETRTLVASVLTEAELASATEEGRRLSIADLLALATDADA